jgi:hypothetical protein
MATRSADWWTRGKRTTTGTHENNPASVLSKIDEQLDKFIKEYLKANQGGNSQ